MSSMDKAHGADAFVNEARSPVEQGTFDGIHTAVSAYDKRDMHRMGKKQEFRRNFKIISTVGFTTCVMGTWEILLTSNTQGLLAGGLPGLFWSLVWCYTGQTFVVLSLAEMASMAPTAGGQYHWVSEFAPARFQRSLSYLSGWLSTISWQSIVTIDCFLVGGIVQALIVLNNENFVAERWQVTLLTMASVVVLSLFNIFAAKHLPLAEGIFALLHVFAFVPVIAVLWVLCPTKQTASAVFTEFTDNGAGWPNIGASVLVGQVSSMFVVLGSDSVAHMSEEVLDAGVIVPKSMIWAFFLNIPFTFLLLITYLFCIGNVEEALTSTTGYPFVYVFQNAIGSVSGTTGLVIVVEILLLMITASVIASASRQTFAFARDRGMPASSWLGKVHPRLKIPVNSIIFTIVFTVLLSLINIGSTTAFNALLSLAVSALMATYVLSIGCVTLRRFRGEPLPSARWSLGKYGLPVNVTALIYACWCFFWSFWPNAYEVTEVNFNWASVLFVGFMIICCAAYWLGARKKYEGPVAKVVDVDSLHSETEMK
ncbi:Amino acid permease-like protein 8 [Elsinoe fawcettii]|nr:Amino acid permease-like protein 8 [Elsinoe fawcettii]